MEITDLDHDVRMYLQRRFRIFDVLRSNDPRRFTSSGEGEVTVLLRVVSESTNGAAALTLPILRAVSACMHEVWIAQGLRLIVAFDEVGLVALHAQLRDLGLEDQLERALRTKLTLILGPPHTPPAEPVKAKPRKKSARPHNVSEAAWSAALAIRRERKNRAARVRHAAKRKAEAMAA
jgi:hypothetical protein